MLKYACMKHYIYIYTSMFTSYTKWEKHLVKMYVEKCIARRDKCMKCMWKYIDG